MTDNQVLLVLIVVMGVAYQFIKYDIITDKQAIALYLIALVVLIGSIATIGRVLYIAIVGGL